MHRFEDLVALSPGSRLISYTFENKELRFQLFHEGRGHLIAVAVPTDTVHGRTLAANPACRIDLFDLAQYLPVIDGRHAPPTDPKRFVDHGRSRLTLAYGRRTSDVRWLLALNGRYPLLACLVKNLSEIRWTIE